MISTLILNHSRFDLFEVELKKIGFVETKYMEGRGGRISDSIFFLADRADRADKITKSVMSSRG